MNVQGLKRSLSEISISTLEQDLANSLRSIGWMGDDPEAPAFHQALTKEVQSFIIDFNWPSYTFEETLSSAKYIQKQDPKHYSMGASSGLDIRFHKSIQETDLLTLAACGLLYGFERFLRFLYSTNNTEWNGLKPMEWALHYKNFPAMDVLHKYGVPLPIIPLTFFNVKQLEKFDFSRSRMQNYLANGDCVWDENFAREVLQRPFPLNNLDGNGHSIIHCAAHFPNVSEEFIESASQLGVTINSGDHLQWTALHFAVRINNIPMVRKLVMLGADVDCRDHISSTPLMKVATPEMTSLLLDLGADSNLQNQFTHTALTRVLNERNPNPEIIRILRLAGQKSRL